MGLRRLIAGPARFQLVERRDRGRRLAETEFGARPAEHEARLVAERRDDDRRVEIARLGELAERQTGLGERGAVGDGVDDRQLLFEFAIAALGIERGDDAAAGAARAGRAQPFRNDFDHDIGQRADARQEQDDGAPRHEAAGAAAWTINAMSIPATIHPIGMPNKRSSFGDDASRQACDLAIAGAFVNRGASGGPAVAADAWRD